MNSHQISGLLFDYARMARTGLPEAVFAENKPPEILLAMLAKFADGTPPILFTRLPEAAFAQCPAHITAKYDYDPVSRTAWAATLPARPAGSVCILSAGTSDAPIAREAARTLQYLGIKFTLMEDCGVAALWRMTQRLGEINSHTALIVVAGMEGALASVAGGLVSCPVFAVPTSVGYGVASGDRAALNGMLACCAQGVAVLNIDNGYGAACAAARIINKLAACSAPGEIDQDALACQAEKQEK